jgi:sarcosine oxidase subunit gamma
MNSAPIKTEVSLQLQGKRDRVGLKGPRAAQWLEAQGILLPVQSNTWAQLPDRGGDGLLAARLGVSEFFLEDAAEGATLPRLARILEARPPGVYAVPREDWGFLLRGAQVHEVLAQVCNINFEDLPLDAQPLIMTLMIGIAVLVVPRCAAGERQYRIWCDPSFGPYLGNTLGAVVIECGGRYTGVSV